MTMAGIRGDTSVPTAQELRRQVTRTCKELGRTVTALASKAEQSAASNKQVAQVTDRLRDTAAQVGHQLGHLVDETDLDSVRGKAGRAVTAARSNRTALLTAAGVLAVLLIRRTRRARRATLTLGDGGA
ncbi:hypothetical protein ACFVX6_32500 [Streptomyces sp. NPDC058289]|uniref:hypothetical protein n=1 Tax=Streptomyces sp. NPDC058289 TaxID=3346425 RepID=UPI0036F133B3